MQTTFSETGVETIPQNATRKSSVSSTSKTLNVTLLSGEWSSSAGGLSTLNREVAIKLAEQKGLKVSLLCPEGACSNEENAEWAKAIEAVRNRYQMRLEEITLLKASYEETYSWRKQIDALVEKMWKMVHGKSC